jgi:hypothetical protein
VRAHRKTFGYGVVPSGITRTGFILLVILAVLGIAVPAMACDAAWYDSGWSHRKPVTIDRTKVVSDQKDFPVLINLGGDPDLAYRAQSSGRDIVFTLADGKTKIPCKVESYMSSNGALTAWVKVPVLSSGANTQLFMYYGNSGASNQQDQSGTWNDVYKGNWRKRDIVSWVQTEYNNHNNPSTFYTVGAAEAKAVEVVPQDTQTPIPTPTPVPTVEPAADTAPTKTQVWNDCGWSYRRSITIDHSKVVADQVDFPVLISPSSDPGLAAHAQPSGNDIIFTLSDEVTKIPHRIESYTPATGALVAWVKVPALSSSVNTVLYMYYGNPNSPAQQDTTTNWSYRFKGTWNRKAVSSWILTKYNNQMSPSTFYSMGSEAYQPQSCAPAPVPTATPTPTPTPTPVPVPDSAPLPVDPTPTPTPVEPTPTQTPVDPTPVPTAEPTPEPTPVPFSCPGGTYQLVTGEGTLAGCVAITNDWTVNETTNDLVDSMSVSYLTADSYCLAGARVDIGYDTTAPPTTIDLSASESFDTGTCLTSGTLNVDLPEELGDIPTLFVTPTAVVQKMTTDGASAPMTAGVPAPDNPIYYIIQG